MQLLLTQDLQGNPASSPERPRVERARGFLLLPTRAGSRRSVDNFLDGATDSLTETVEENLHGACHDLDSGACRATMSDKTSDLLLFASARSSTGGPQSV